jgi:hypothetical protein
MNKVNNLPIQIDQNDDDLMFVNLKTIEDLLNVEVCRFLNFIKNKAKLIKPILTNFYMKYPKYIIL